MKSTEQEVAAFNSLKEKMLQGIAENLEKGEKDLVLLVGGVSAAPGTLQREVVRRALEDANSWSEVIIELLKGSTSFEDFLTVLMTTWLNRKERMRNNLLKRIESISSLGALLAMHEILSCESDKDDNEKSKEENKG